nr:MAG TPA: hypothetical protein [Caudoviricetes sp.]
MLVAATATYKSRRYSATVKRASYWGQLKAAAC